MQQRNGKRHFQSFSGRRYHVSLNQFLLLLLHDMLLESQNRSHIFVINSIQNLQMKKRGETFFGECSCRKDIFKTKKVQFRTNNRLKSHVAWFQVQNDASVRYLCWHIITMFDMSHTGDFCHDIFQVGRTEVKRETNNPVWNKRIEHEFSFEREQYVMFEVWVKGP